MFGFWILFCFCHLEVNRITTEEATSTHHIRLMALGPIAIGQDQTVYLSPTPPQSPTQKGESSKCISALSVQHCFLRGHGHSETQPPGCFFSTVQLEGLEEPHLWDWAGLVPHLSHDAPGLQTGCQLCQFRALHKD